MERDFNATLRSELGRVARFGANLADAFSCLIFLPSPLLSGRFGTPSDGEATHDARASEYLEIAAAHSLSNDLVRECMILRGSGLIGWVAKNRRAIHVSPFDRDSTTLGFYGRDQQLKSFIGIPLMIPALGRSDEELTGVITCDSKKSFSFTKMHGKLLEELAQQASSIISLAFNYHHRSVVQSNWGSFLESGERLTEALGRQSVEALRVRFLNIEQIERTIGSAQTIEHLDQIHRLIQQTLPPHFPSYRMPQGDIVLLVDNMMTGFYENKIKAVCERVTHPGTESVRAQGMEVPRLAVDCVKRSFRGRKERTYSLEQLITDSVPNSENTQSYPGAQREYRTA